MEETIKYFDNAYSVTGIDIAYISRLQWQEIRAALVEVQKPAHNSRYVTALKALDEYELSFGHDLNYHAFQNWCEDRLKPEEPACT